MNLTENKERLEMPGSGSMHAGDGYYDVISNCHVNYKAISFENVFGEGESPLLHLLDGHDRVCVVIDSVVNKIFGEKIRSFFERARKELHFVVVDCKESNKNLETTLSIIKKVEEVGVLRREQVVAIGGGVLLDLAGFVSSIYRRGIPYISIPTTLMGVIDASVGIKTGINHLGRRNRLGSYHHAKTVLIDTDFLTTLSRRETANGMGEILKMAVIKDRVLFELLEKHGKQLLDTNFQDYSVARDVIHRSIKGMLEELAPNLWERDLKRVVDFGHSFSPLVEMNALPELLHGEAVALDVIFSSVLSNRRGMLSDQELTRVMKVASSLDLMNSHELFQQADFLEKALADTVLHRNGAQNLPFPAGIGKCRFVNDLHSDEIAAAAGIMKSFDWKTPCKK